MAAMRLVPALTALRLPAITALIDAAGRKNL
jgi:hypothetical protein